MRFFLILALLAPLTAHAQGSRGGRGGNLMPGGGSAFPAAPQQIVAPEVPVLEGLPHAVKIGYTVYLSAMVPLDSAGRVVGANDLAAQTRQVVVNLGAVMRAARGVAGDVVKVTVYVRDLTPEKAAIVQRELLDGLDRSAPPALTIVGASSFADPAILVMVDGIAELRSEFPDRSRSGRPER
jgi:enamine deaminase RidA (YjgF/YER057c/UK114 family)